MGGKQDGDRSNTVWKIDVSDNFKFTMGPSMINERENFGCATMNIGNEKVIVVVGGNSGYISNDPGTWILDPSSNKWLPGMCSKI